MSESIAYTVNVFQKFIDLLKNSPLNRIIFLMFKLKACLRTKWRFLEES